MINAGGCIPIASFSVHKLSHVPVPYKMAIRSGADARIEGALRNICGRLGLGYSQLRDEQRVTNKACSVAAATALALALDDSEHLSLGSSASLVHNLHSIFPAAAF